MDIEIKKKKYTIQEKLQAIKYAESHSICQTASKFQVAPKSIREWQHQKQILLYVSDKNQRYTLHKGKRPKSLEFEEQLLDFIQLNRKLGNQITTWCIIQRLIQLNPEFKAKSLQAMQMWCYRFLKRNGLSLRMPTKINKKMPENCYYQIQRFLRVVLRMRSLKNFPLQAIGNMDETPLYFNMINRHTVDKIGEKQILVRTTGQEKLRVSLVLTVLADGSKLPPYLIFKSKKGATVEKSLKQHDLVKKEKIHVSCQQNAWNDASAMMYWIKNIWRQYGFFKYKGDTLLIMDSATSHKVQNVKEKLVDMKTNVIFIPQGLTHLLQPLDFSLNKKFKDQLKQKYIQYCLEKGTQEEKISREQIIEWVYQLWEDPTILTREMIQNSFKYCGISNSLYGEEDDWFRGYDDKEIINQIEDNAKIQEEKFKRDQQKLMDIGDSYQTENSRQNLLSESDIEDLN